MQMLKDLTVQEVRDLLDAIDHAYYRIEEITNFADCSDEEEEAYYEQWNRLNKLEEKLETVLKWK